MTTKGGQQKCQKGPVFHDDRSRLYDISIPDGDFLVDLPPWKTAL